MMKQYDVQSEKNNSCIAYSSLAVLLASFLSGCGGGANTSQNTETDIEVKAVVDGNQIKLDLNSNQVIAEVHFTVDGASLDSVSLGSDLDERLKIDVIDNAVSIVAGPGDLIASTHYPDFISLELTSADEEVIFSDWRVIIDEDGIKKEVGLDQLIFPDALLLTASEVEAINSLQSRSNQDDHSGNSDAEEGSHHIGCGDGMVPTSIVEVSDFSLTDIDGKSHQLKDYLQQGKQVIVEFFSSGCGHCDSLHGGGDIKELLASDSNRVFFSIEINDLTPQSQLEDGVNGRDFSASYSDSDRSYLFNPSTTELNTALSSYDFNICGYPGIYSIKQEGDQYLMMAVDRTAYPVQDIDEQINSFYEAPQVDSNDVEMDLLSDDIELVYSAEVLQNFMSEMNAEYNPNLINIIEFFSTTCSHCENLHASGILDQAASRSEIDLHLFDVNFLNTAEDLQTYLAGGSDENSVVYDLSQEQVALLGVTSVPLIFLAFNEEQMIVLSGEDRANFMSDQVNYNLEHELLAFQEYLNEV